jgi:hypothetical protein
VTEQRETNPPSKRLADLVMPLLRSADIRSAVPDRNSVSTQRGCQLCDEGMILGGVREEDLVRHHPRAGISAYGLGFVEHLYEPPQTLGVALRVGQIDHREPIEHPGNTLFRKLFPRSGKD